MRVIFDQREETLYYRCTAAVAAAAAATSPHILSMEVLPLGDMVLTHTTASEPLFILERKSIQDLLASIKDGRYREQSHRLQHASAVPPHHVVYVIEGMLTHSRPDEKQRVYSAMTTLCAFKGFSVFRTMSIQETAELVLGMASKLDRELAKGGVFLHQYGQNAITSPAATNLEESSCLSLPTSPPQPPPPPPEYTTVVKKIKKDNVTQDNLLEIMLCQIPGISSVIGHAIALKCHRSMPMLVQMLQDDSSCLDQLQYPCKGKFIRVSKTAIQKVKTFLLRPPPVDHVGPQPVDPMVGMGGNLVT